MRQSLYMSALALLSLGMASKAPPAYPVVHEHVIACEADSTEACFWYGIYKHSECNEEKPCDKMVIYFPDQGENCKSSYRFYSEGGDSHDLNDHLLNYANKGYIAVCAGLFETNAAYASEAHFSEAHRMDKMVESITRAPELAEVWNRKALFFTGSGIGATSPMVAMAQTDYDRKSSWHGEKITAACLLDGTYDVATTENFLHANGAANNGACQIYRNVHICNRYYNTGTCQHPLPPENDVSEDTLVNPDGSLNFRLGGLVVTNWKLIECGSALTSTTPCGQYGEGDVSPAEPMRRLCEKIDQSSGHQCEIQSFPQTPHSKCAYSPSSFEACLTWFDGLMK